PQQPQQPQSVKVVPAQIPVAVQEHEALNTAVLEQDRSAQEMPPPWEELPPEAMDTVPGYLAEQPPVWDDVPLEASLSAESEAVQVPVKGVAQDAIQALEPTPLGDTWHAIVTQLDESQAIVALVRELAMQSQLIAQEGHVWTLRVQRTSLNQAMPRERLLKALAHITDCTSLHVENGKVSDTPALRNKARAEARQKQAEAIVMNDPSVQHLQQSLGATIVPGSIRPV
ncbi:DNA polymerase III subunit gamma/tau C-terminal domain-containing protein, partial [Comamonas sp. UBA7840]